MILVALTLVSGTLFYHRIERRSLVDPFYFCAITLTTAGYGDPSPTTALSKIFTVVHIFAGIGIILMTKYSMARRPKTRRRHPRGTGSEEGD